MKELKKPLYVGLVLAIAGLMCLQAGATSNISANKDHKVLNCLNPGTNILLSVDSPEDDFLPDITKDNQGNIIVTYTHEISSLETTSIITFSSDNKETWQSYDINDMYTLSGYYTYGQVALMRGSFYEEDGFDGIWFDVNDLGSESTFFALIHDITDPETWEPYQYTMGSNPGSSCNNLEDDMWYIERSFEQNHGPVIAKINDDQAMNQGIMLFWEDASPDNFGSRVDNWDSGTGPEGMYTPAEDIDTAPIHDSNPAQTEADFFYLVCQSNSDLYEKSQVLFKKCIPDIQDDIEFCEASYFLDGGSTYDATHPSVEASGNKVAVVYMTNENGDWDIKCEYSSDASETWQTTMIASESGVDETFPAIYWGSGIIQCAYAKNGNLFLTTSEDGGATWTEAMQLNDEDGTVVEEVNAIDIHAGGVVWTDNRNGNKDIYTATSGAAAPVIGIKSIGKGFGVTAVIENTGTADAVDVEGAITIDASLMILGKSTPFMINVAAGGEEEVSTGFILGLGPATITVTAGDASMQTTGTVIGPFVL